MKLRWVILLAVLTVIVAGCGSFETSPASSANPVNNVESQAGPTQPAPTTPAKNPIQPTELSGVIEMPSNPPAVEKFIGLAKDDLATSLTINTEQINVRGTMETIWPDAALGCPKPGKVYAQGKVPGYKVWLEANGQEYIYHTDLTGQVVLCPDINPDKLDNVPPTSTGPTQDPNIGVPIK